MMKKIIALFLILGVFLVACQSAPASPTPLPNSEAEPDQVGQETSNTDLPPLPEVSPTPAAEQAGNAREAYCTVVSRQPTPGPTEQSLVPSVGEADWAHGPEGAKVTIIEYGDFQ
jgi:hypothetical protein